MAILKWKSRTEFDSMS